MTKQIVVTLMFATAASSQTQVDLRTQSKSVDFQAATCTKPFKSGATLPSTCTQGELFFLTSAAPGSNIVMCSSPNVWTPQNALTLSNNGTVLASRSVLNLAPGFGFSTVAVDTGSQINVQQTADTAVLLTTSNHQSGQPLVCASASASSIAYTCSMVPTLAGYTSGQVLYWKPDANGGGGATTLNIDTLGARPVKLGDGTADPSSSDIVGGRLYPVWYDGTVFRIISTGSGNSGSSGPTPNVGTFGSLPTCITSAKGAYYPTDSNYSSIVCDGTNWNYLVPGGGKASLPLPAFAWANRGSASVTTTNGGETLHAGVGRTDTAFRCETVTPPVRRTVFIVGGWSGLWNGSAGLTFGFADSSNAVLALHQGSGGQGTNLQVAAESGIGVSAFTPVLGLYSYGAGPFGMGAWGWYQVEVDATNVYFRSGDGHNWTTLYQEAKGAHLGTVNRVCYGAGLDNSSGPSYLEGIVTVLSWGQ